ncbi:MAG: hypothetical protein R2712_32350, partial [Vicinamibacterales bacterium]
MALDERLTRLEVTVASRFDELTADIRGVENRLRAEIGSTESRLRLLIETSRDEHRTTADALGGTLERIQARL